MFNTVTDECLGVVCSFQLRGKGTAFFVYFAQIGGRRGIRREEILVDEDPGVTRSRFVGAYPWMLNVVIEKRGCDTV